MQVFGPVLHEVASPESLNTSVKDFYFSIVKHSKTPEQLAAFQGSWVDVRDLADAHVKAIEVPNAGGQRFIISSGNFIWQDWCTCILALYFSSKFLKHRFFPFVAVDAVNELAIPGITAPTGTPGAGKVLQHKQIYNTTKSRTVLGVQYKDKPSTAKDSLANFKERGWAA